MGVPSRESQNLGCLSVQLCTAIQRTSDSTIPHLTRDTEDGNRTGDAGNCFIAASDGGSGSQQLGVVVVEGRGVSGREDRRWLHPRPVGPEMPDRDERQNEPADPTDGGKQCPEAESCGNSHEVDGARRRKSARVIR
jgi:hypothetical protein